MKPISEQTCCVIDSGLFLHVAHRLARDCKKVYYWTPTENSFPTVKKGCIGDGYDDIERVDDFWSIKGECDFFVFTHIGYSGIQKELKSQGIPCWGPGEADSLEANRGKFLKMLKEVGLQVPNHKIVEGIDNLRDYLRDKEDKWIKISKWRADFETSNWRSWELDSTRLDYWSVKFGSVKNEITFYVFDDIETNIENGGDFWFSGGKFPQCSFQGMEAKNKAYLLTFCEADEMPDPVKITNDAIAPVLASYEYSGFISTEIRTVEPDDFYFTDITTRCGSPPSDVMCEMLGNYSEIISRGANGECIEPDQSAKFGMQLYVKLKRIPDEWFEVKIPEELEQWFKPMFCLKAGERTCWPPDKENDAGWLVAIGDTISDTLEKLKEYVDFLPDGLEADISPMALLFEEVKESEKMDMPFTDQPLPEPEEVV